MVVITEHQRVMQYNMHHIPMQQQRPWQYGFQNDYRTLSKGERYFQIVEQSMEMSRRIMDFCIKQQEREREMELRESLAEPRILGMPKPKKRDPLFPWEF